MKGQVLQASDLGLEEAQVHQGGPAVVVALDLFHAGAFDAEDRHPLPVDAPDLDLPELAAADEPQGSQEEVLGLKHRRLLRCTPVDCWRRDRLRWVRSR